MADGPRFHEQPLTYRVEIRRTDVLHGANDRSARSIVLKVTTEVPLEDLLGDYSEQTGAQFG